MAAVTFPICAKPCRGFRGVFLGEPNILLFLMLHPTVWKPKKDPSGGQNFEFRFGVQGVALFGLVWA